MHTPSPGKRGISAVLELRVSEPQRPPGWHFSPGRADWPARSHGPFGCFTASACPSTAAAGVTPALAGGSQKGHGEAAGAFLHSKRSPEGAMKTSPLSQGNFGRQTRGSPDSQGSLGRLTEAGPAPRRSPDRPPGACDDSRGSPSWSLEPCPDFRKSLVEAPQAFLGSDEGPRRSQGLSGGSPEDFDGSQGFFCDSPEVSRGPPEFFGGSHEILGRPQVVSR